MTKTTVLAVVVLMGARLAYADAQSPSSRASGLQVTMSLVPGVMWGQFRGSDPHLYMHYKPRVGPSLGGLIAVDWREFGGASEIGFSRLRLGDKLATGFYVRGGARYQPEWRVAGFYPGLQVGILGLGLFTPMQPSETPVEVGSGVPTCCTGDTPNLAEEWFLGYWTALSIERPIAKGFAFWSRAGIDVARLTSMRRETTSYTGVGKPKWVGGHISASIQYTAWPRRTAR